MPPSAVWASVSRRTPLAWRAAAKSAGVGGGGTAAAEVAAADEPGLGASDGSMRARAWTVSKVTVRPKARPTAGDTSPDPEAGKAPSPAP